MITSMLYCLTMMWTACPGDVAGHNFYVDEIQTQTLGVETQAAVCFEDQEPHIVKVQCFNSAGNVGPMSDGSDSIQRMIVPPLYSYPLDLATQADLDADLVVGFSDFLLFADAYQSCNDGMAEVPCQ